MRELSLFSGAGGGLLGTNLLGWTTIGYVEWDDYCQRVLAQRIQDGVLDDAPIFGDLRAFNMEFAPLYQGVVDVITGGFPCQPFSQAGKRAGAGDERNMWPATIECIRQVRPRYALLENVRGLLSSGYFGRILADLAECGYDCRWRCLSAAEVDAPHKRDRLWIVAYPHLGYSYADHKVQARRELSGLRCEDVAHASGPRSEARVSGQDTGQEGYSEKPDNGSGGLIGGQEGDYWATEPSVGRVAHGVAHRVDRLKALGNGQVPAVVKTVWGLLNP